MAAPGDTVTLRVPRDAAYLPLLHMVLGGIAIRQDLSFDDLDDVQLAVDNIVAEDDGTQQALTMTVTVEDDTLTIRLAPLSNHDLHETLRLGQVPPGPRAVASTSACCCARWSITTSCRTSTRIRSPLRCASGCGRPR